MKAAKSADHKMVTNVAEFALAAFLIWKNMRKRRPASAPVRRVRERPQGREVRQDRIDTVIPNEPVARNVVQHAALEPPANAVGRGAPPQAAEAAGRDAAPKADVRKEERNQERQAAAIAAKNEPYWKALLHVFVAAAKDWSANRASSKGAALALYTLFSLAPMLILVVAIAGFFFGADAVRAALVDQMSNLMGVQGADAIKTMLAGGQHEQSGFWAGLVSTILVLVSATGAFAELKDSLDELWEVPPSTQSGLWQLIRERFLSFGLILVLALMLLASLAVSTALAAFGNIFGGEDSPFRIVSLILSNVISFAVLTGLFAVIFKYLPAVKIAWKDVFIGAVLTAVLFSIGKFGIGLYVAHADIDSSYGAAGSVVILITWIYYSAQIFFYGALFTHDYAESLGSRAAASLGANGESISADKGSSQQEKAERRPLPA